jgi:hypothetical protein
VAASSDFHSRLSSPLARLCTVSDLQTRVDMRGIFLLVARGVLTGRRWLRLAYVLYSSCLVPGKPFLFRTVHSSKASTPPPIHRKPFSLPSYSPFSSIHSSHAIHHPTPSIFTPHTRLSCAPRLARPRDLTRPYPLFVPPLSFLHSPHSTDSVLYSPFPPTPNRCGPIRSFSHPPRPFLFDSKNSFWGVQC